jgi:hypothetical protein
VEATAKGLAAVTDGRGLFCIAIPPALGVEDAGANGFVIGVTGTLDMGAVTGWQVRGSSVKFREKLTEF